MRSGGAGVDPRPSAYTLIEILVASSLFFLTVAWAFGTIYYNRRAADRTDWVDEYREMRILFNRVGRDLQDASRVKLPTYDYHSPKLVMLDSRDRQVVYEMQDAAGAAIASEPAADDKRAFRVVRTAGVAGDLKSEVIPQTGGVRWMKFTRLGERLVGMTIKMKPRAEGKPCAIYTASMSVNRVVM
ncbi:MAG: hypothetical protein HY303_07115 [Candidatus Wallbacteria bacterium]|nr:hypothetical protein [Candidatus Wallbacteria bacterium]